MMNITTQEPSSAHRDDFYGALRKNDLEKLSRIYSDDYYARENRRERVFQGANSG
jgi:hypothetical protein